MKTAIILAASILAAIVLTGCASFVDPSKMTAEQIKAMAADNKGMAYCMVAQNAAGNVTGTFANLDLLPRITGSSVTIEPNCKMTIGGGAAASAPK